MNNNFYGNNQGNGWQYPPGYNFFGNRSGENSGFFHMLQEKENERQRLKSIGFCCGLAVILYILLSYAQSFAVFLLSSAFPSVNVIFEDAVAMFAYDVISSVISLGVPFAVSFLVMKKKECQGNLPFNGTNDSESAAFLTLLLLPVMIFSSVIINIISTSIQEYAGIEFTGSPMSDISIKGAESTVMAFLSIAVIPAILEEFAVRGVVLQSLRRYGDKFAIVMSALLFSLLHGNMVQIPYTFVGGIILGYLAVKTNSLWPPIILHFLNNAYSVIVLSVTDTLGDTAGNMAVLLMYAVFIGFGVIGFLGYRNQEKHPLSKGRVTCLKTGEKIRHFVFNGPMIVAIVILILITSSNIIY